MYQQTIKQSAELKGIGLHTGKEVTMKFLPADPNSGVKFQRVDLEGEPIIAADVDLVVSVDRGTTLQKGEVVVATVEHLMAAITGLEIDNILIQLDGMEIPIMDGSASPFIEALEKAGIQEQNEDREVFELRETIFWKDEESGVEMLAMPSDRYKLTALIDYQSRVLGQQHASLDRISDFKKEFSGARTFCFLHELEQLVEADLIKGGDLNNAIVVVDKPVDNAELSHLSKMFGRPDIQVVEEGILNNVELRFQNEPARHKLLDLIGDLALVGHPIKANIIATKPGHKANVEFGKILKSHIKAEIRKPVVPVYNPDVEPIVDVPGVEKLLPHRAPFLFVDKIISLQPKEVIGVKGVTFNEPFFKGHFPGNPVMPGVIQIEAMAQTGGVLALNTVDDPENYDTYFLKIDQAKFKRKVVPGDTLIIKMELISPIRRGIVEMKGTCFVGSNVVTEAVMVARIMRRETAE
jgi:UDP-3-O-[3-hydroxymyristoyl] N-acetylglucosamine deacetylase/3-hydroxyacyl-[acyl-carrier-protein] dehydratase